MLLPIAPTRHLFFTGKGGVGKTVAKENAITLDDLGSSGDADDEDAVG